MPTTEKPLRPDFSVPDSVFTVNAAVEHIRASSADSCKELLEQWQDHVLQLVLGPAWAPHQTEPAPWHCKVCGSCVGFKRRGSRPRQLLTSVGKIRFRLRQVTCLACEQVGSHTTFSPFPELLDMPVRSRIAGELSRKVVDAATRVSYQQSSELCEVMTGQRLSATSIHAQVRVRAPEELALPSTLTDSAQQPPGEAPVCPPAPLEATSGTQTAVKIPLLLLDSTRVCAGANPKGTAVNLAMAVLGWHRKGKRAALEKALVACGVGDWNELKQDLRRVWPELILIDGDKELMTLVHELYPGVPVQRCIWHIPHTLGFALWKGKMPKQERDVWLRRIALALYTVSTSAEGVAAVHGLAQELAQAGYNRAAGMLDTAAATVFTHLDLPAFIPGGRHGRCAPIATSYIERQMREINRRGDNGGRWSEAGLQRLLRLALLRRFDGEHWDQLWVQPA
jgi:hypothetical protein